MNVYLDNENFLKLELFNERLDITALKVENYKIWAILKEEKKWCKTIYHKGMFDIKNVGK